MSTLHRMLLPSVLVLHLLNAAPGFGQLHQEVRTVDVGHGQSRENALGIGFGRIKGPVELLLNVTADDPGVQIKTATPVEMSGETIWTALPPNTPDLFRFRNTGVDRTDRRFAAVIRGELIVTGPGSGPPPVFHIAVADIDLDLANVADDQEASDENTSATGAPLSLNERRALTLRVGPRRSGKVTLSASTPGIVKVLADQNGQPGAEVQLPWEADVTADQTFTFHAEGLARGVTSLVARFTPTVQGAPSSGSNSNPLPEDRVDIDVDQELEYVRYLTREEGGTTGDLTMDSPAQRFGVGARFFPDARLPLRTGNNVVRVRAVLRGMPAQPVRVYFSSFDVDDPTDSAAPVDPNDRGGTANGGDNRGRVGANFLSSGPSGEPGSGSYNGALRELGRQFSNRRVISTSTKVEMENGVRRTVAEVELATSYAPGDNFRVGAALAAADLSALNSGSRRSDVPTTGLVNFPGKFAPQLAVWRRIHLELDGMAQRVRELTPQDNNGQGDLIVNGQIVAVATDTLPPQRTSTIKFEDWERGFNRPQPGLTTVRLNVEIPDEESGRFAGGTLRLGPPRVASPQIPSEFLIYAQRPISATQHEFVIFFNPPARGSEFESSDEWESFLETEFAVTLIPAPIAPGSQLGGIEVTFNRAVTLNEFAPGILRIFLPGGPRNALIRSNGATINGRARFFVELPGGPAIDASFVGLRADAFQDDFLRPQNNPHGQPVLRANTTDVTPMAGLMAASPNRLLNRFADAYLQPDIATLNTTAENPRPLVTGDLAVGHMNLDGFVNATGGFRDTAARENEYFWVGYLMAGFEWHPDQDSDPVIERTYFGQTFNSTSGALSNAASVILYEGSGDAGIFGGIPPQLAIARIAVHELGHQFNVPIDQGVEEHRDQTPNIMNTQPLLLPDPVFFFHPEDLNTLRKRRNSP